MDLGKKERVRRIADPIVLPAVMPFNPKPVEVPAEPEMVPVRRG